MTLLGMRMGALNLDFIVDKDGDVYIIEIGPRNGGNLITDAIRKASDIDLAKYTILAALGMDCSAIKQEPIHTYISSYIVHSLEDGIFDHVYISLEIEKDILLADSFFSHGDTIERFDNAGLGAILIRFDRVESVTYRMDHMEEFIRVMVK